MDPFALEAGSPLATAIQSAAQAKLIENGWAPEESDTTLSEYVTMMLVNGKDEQGVRSELGGELLGVGEEDEMVAAFVGWLFGEAQRLSAAASGGGDEGMGMDSGEGAPVTTTMMEAPQSEAAGDESMGDAGAVDGAPSGPKAMRDPTQQSPTRSNNNSNSQQTRGGRGRGGRMLGQLNRNMDRNSSSQPDDPLRRIKGAASGSGRIDGHANRQQNAPRGPRGGALANGVQRAMNGGRGGGRGGMGGGMGMNGMAGMGGMDMNAMPQEQQAMMMQMMEMQANMMATMMANGGSLPGSPGLHNNQNGGGGGGFPPRGGRGGRSMADRISGRGGRGGARNGAGTDGEGSVGGMDIDRPLEPEKKPLFDTMCKFNLKCLNPDCGFAHQSPANTRPGISLDMSDTCSYGPACQNTKCLSRHPSPALRNGGGSAGGYAGGAGFAAGGKAEVVCRFYPNCSAGAACPFKHPDTRPCRNGADCSVEGCTFAHSSIACRYNPCVRAECPYKHAAGQRRGAFSDKVWTADGADGSAGIFGAEGKSERFAGLAGEGAGEEELILPGKQNGEAMEEVAPTATEVDVVS
ncbi:oxygen-dependent protoporphyrinogen oxidase [Elasticomyces elasticus]|uniref:Oxygen-dependent protoporphyrinogen oxidase n=1 Tax=Elasticomyces elasticus TaxID=574655 RepID=A0AAN7WB05_9PEZI|nr:oxygen-dependent protoporphyrinogen oxidase [Elasticomyces elasticus]